MKEEEEPKTSQSINIFLFDDIEYYISAIEFPENFLNIYNLLGFRPIATSSACWRGYDATYALFENNIMLKDLDTNNGDDLKNEPPKLNNKLPEIFINKNWGSDEETNTMREFKYTNINLMFPYTGSIIITKNFTGSAYISMLGLRTPFDFETVILLSFKDGKIILSKDISDLEKSLSIFNRFNLSDEEKEDKFNLLDRIKTFQYY